MSVLSQQSPPMPPSFHDLVTDAMVLSRSLFSHSLPSRFKQRFQEKKPIILALSGPSGSGKSYIREQLIHHLTPLLPVSSFTQDNYYRDFELDFPQIPLADFYHRIDLDDPAHIRFSKLAEDLTVIRQHTVGQEVAIPRFRFGTPTRKPGIEETPQSLQVAPIVITEGIHAFGDPRLLPLYDLKLYIHVDEEKRKQRWISRNQRENRGTTENMWQTSVNCLDNFIEPNKALADISLNNNLPSNELDRFLIKVAQTIRLALPHSAMHCAH